MKPLRFAVAIFLVILVAPLAFGEIIWVVNSGNVLVSFDSASRIQRSSVQISGLASGENIVGIDFRPASGGLVAMTDASRIYNLNLTTGAATAIGTSAFTPVLAGTEFGFDFNPTVDRIRVVSNSEQNLRLHPDTGAVAATDTALAYATGDPGAGTNPSVGAVAYTNSTATSTITTLYAIDTARDVLVRIGSLNSAPVSPNTGQLFTVGSLGVNAGDLVTLDISSATNVAFATLQVDGSTDLYTIDLSSGAATRLGAVAGVTMIRGMSVEQAAIVQTIPVVGSAAGLNGTSFKSDLILTNNSAFATTVTIEFFRSSATAGTGATGSVDITLAPGEQRVIRNVVSTQFNATGTGALRITSSRPVSAIANVYNDQVSVGRGTFGQLIRAYDETERRNAGFLPALSNINSATNSGARTNIGFFNPGSTDVTVTLTARSATGTTLATGTKVVPAFSHQQVGLPEIFPTLGATAEVYVSYTATSTIFVYASVVDNVSGDGYYVPAVSTR